MMVPIEIDVLTTYSEDQGFPTKTPLVLDKLPACQQLAFHELSRPKEAASIVPHLRPLSPEEVSALDPSQVVGSRWLDVWKPTEPEKMSSWPVRYQIPPDITPKSRLIIQGYMDPQLLELQRTVASPEKLDLMLSLQLSANMGCVLLYREPMYVSKDGRHSSKVVPDGERTTSSLGGLILMQVDDFYMAGNGPLFQDKLHKLEAKFNFGRWVSFSTPRAFNGRTIQQVSPSEFTIRVVDYCTQLQPLEIPSSRVQPMSSMASPQQQTHFRALVGAMLWAARAGAPTLPS